MLFVIGYAAVILGVFLVGGALGFVLHRRRAREWKDEFSTLYYTVIRDINAAVADALKPVDLAARLEKTWAQIDAELQQRGKALPPIPPRAATVDAALAHLRQWQREVGKMMSGSYVRVPVNADNLGVYESLCRTIEELMGLSNERRWKILHAHVAALSARLAKIDTEAENPDHWVHSGANIICPTCCLEYRDHPDHPQEKWLTILCDGSLVKL